MIVIDTVDDLSYQANNEYINHNMHSKFVNLNLNLIFLFQFLGFHKEFIFLEYYTARKQINKENH